MAFPCDSLPAIRTIHMSGFGTNRSGDKQLAGSKGRESWPGTLFAVKYTDSHRQKTHFVWTVEGSILEGMGFSMGTKGSDTLEGNGITGRADGLCHASDTKDPRHGDRAKRLRHEGAYRALCTRCAKSWPFSTTGSSVSSED